MAAVRALKKQQELSKSILRAADDFKPLSESGTSKGAIQVTLEDLEKQWTKFEGNHECAVDGNSDGKLDDEAYFVENTFYTTKMSYLGCKSMLLDLLDAHSSSSSQSCPSPVHSSADNFAQHQRSLPKISLPTFSGRYDEWTSFQDHFQSIVGANSSLAPVEKFLYLKGCLTGEAAKLVSNIAISDSNFQRAWNNLRDRFENKRSIVNAHLDALHSLKPITRKSARDLEHLRSTVSNIIEALDALGGQPKYWDYFLVHFVSKKLDPETHESWELSLGDTTDPPSYKALDTFLSSRVRALETLTVRESAPSTRQPSQHAQYRTARAHTAGAASPMCPLCSDHHYLFQCQQYRSMTPQQRHQYIQESKRCFNCLSDHHVSRECTSAKRCLTCHRKHHTTIHEADRNAPTWPQHQTANVCSPSFTPSPASSASSHEQTRDSI